MVVLVIDSSEQKELSLLTDAIERRGGDAVPCDVEKWPGSNPLTVTAGDDRATFGSQFEYDDVTGAYVNYHRLFRPFNPRFRDGLKTELVPKLNQLREHRGMFDGLCRILDWHDADVIPRLRNRDWQDRKPWQLHLFETLGLPVPTTLFTNDPDEVRAFYEAHDRVIFKAVTRGGSPHVLTDDDLTADRLEALATAPVQFQEYVGGEDLRVYVLDGEVIGAIRYESDSDNFSFKLDVEEGRDIDVQSATVSDDLVKTVCRAAEVAGLTYAAADVRQRSDGTYTLLELNEAPRFAAADVDAGQDVAGALATLLIA